jgi:hypothetical protein
LPGPGTEALCKRHQRVEQGISKAGNKRARWLMVELEWSWLRFQPTSQLSQWFNHRFAGASKRLRRIGIVALARRLAIALWRYLEYEPGDIMASRQETQEIVAGSQSGRGKRARAKDKAGALTRVLGARGTCTRYWPVNFAGLRWANASSPSVMSALSHAMRRNSAMRSIA